MFHIYENTGPFDVHRPHRRPGKHLNEERSKEAAKSCARSYTRKTDIPTIVINDYDGRFAPRAVIAYPLKD